MVDAITLSSAISAAVTFKVQSKVLQNLRKDLVFGDPQYAESGEFDPGHDTLMWTSVPDLTANTTPLTEATRPDKRALSMGTVTCTTTQYGGIVAISDITKVKSPIQIVDIASERLTRESKVVVDSVYRDAISGGGTVRFASSTHSTRATLAATDTVTFPMLRRLEFQMQSNNLPQFSDGFYRFICAPNVADTIIADSSFINTYQYTDREPAVSNEIGRIAGFRVIVTNDAPVVNNGTINVYLSFGLSAIKAWGAGELQSMQMYHVPAGGDHADILAQEEDLGWKVNLGAAVLSNSYYFRVESAGTDLTSGQLA